MAKQWAADLIASVSSNIYFGDIIGYMTNRIFLPETKAFIPDFSPVAGVVQDTYMAVVQTSNNFDPDDEEFWEGIERLATATAKLSGVPATPYTMARKLWDQTRDEGAGQGRGTRGRQAPLRRIPR